MRELYHPEEAPRDDAPDDLPACEECRRPADAFGSLCTRCRWREEDADARGE